MLLRFLAVGILSLLAACARTHSQPMTLVYLVTGPTSATNTKEQKQEIFRGHMANMQRLADERTLLIAGPFSKPQDPARRGIFLFDSPTADQARALAHSDPAVIAGEFAVKITEVSASPALRQTPRLERQLQEELKAKGVEAKPNEPPPSLRPYVIMHADDAARAHRAAAPRLRVIWWVRSRHDSSGVLVLDAQSVDEARAKLLGADLGPSTLDGWYSTKSLERLPR